MRTRPVIDCSKDKHITKQSFKRECDINNIMARYRKTGVLDQDAINQRHAAFADISEIGDYQDCKNRILEAKKAFGDLPALVRNKFANDPAQLLDFVRDENNREEAIELGLIPKPEPPPGPEQETTSPLTAPEAPPEA